jgi:predicted regulator of Ras-like GTPase activity (Roadblock/LC7/MglB family)
VGEAPDLGTMITAFAERVPAVAHAAIVSSDGLPLACSRGFPADLADQLAAITSGVCSLVQGAARIFEGGPVVQTVVVMDRGLLIIRGVTPSTVLTALAAADCDIDQVAYEMALLGEQAAHALGSVARGDPRWPG